MTMDFVLHQIEEETGQAATPESKIADLVQDSLEFISLMARLNVPEESVPSIETVADLFAAVQ